MPHSRYALAVVAMLQVVPALPLPAEAARCEGGRFVRRSVPLVAAPVGGVPGAAAIVVTATGAPRVAISPTCDAVRAQLKGSRKGTGLKATWPRGACRGIPDKVQLRGRIAAGCAVLQGVIKQRKRKPTPFTAYRATGCRDGLLDVDGGEECEIDRHCGARLRCRQCRCEARQSGEPATTTTTTTASTTSTIPGPSAVLRIEAPSALEFGPVAVGDSASAAFLVSNVNLSAPGVSVDVTVDAPGFAITPATFDLSGVGPPQPVTVTFRPLTTGHQTAVITVAVQEGEEVKLLAHGFGGSAPGTGPTLAAEPLFFLSNEVVGGTIPLIGVLPSGLRFPADAAFRSCVFPDDGIIGDLCAQDADCKGGRVCGTFSHCVGGERAGLSCAQNAECPGGFCPADSFEPTDMCGDGTGALYLINEDSATDPTTLEPRGTVARLAFDPVTGARVAADIMYRPLPGTTQIACDALPGSAGGRVYVPERREIANPPPACLRDQREALLSLSKATAAVEVVPGFDDIATAAGQPPCEDFDPVEDIGAARDGSALFVTLGLTGLSRILPQPPLGLVTDFFDRFEVHPDGSLVFILPADLGETGLLDVFRVSPAEGPFTVAALTPCATFAFPNAGGRTALGEIAVGRAREGSNDATLLVTFAAIFSPGTLPPLTSTLLPRGTVAIDAPAGTTGCSVLGLINLELLSRDLMTF